LRHLVAVAAVIGCGRFGFEGRIVGDSAPPDIAIDAPPPERIQAIAFPAR